MEVLKRINAVEIDGKKAKFSFHHTGFWVLLDNHFQQEVLSALLIGLRAEGLSLEHFSVNNVWAAVSDYGFHRNIIVTTSVFFGNIHLDSYYFAVYRAT